MTVTIDGEIRIQDPTPEISMYFSKLLTVPNPAYTNALRMGFATFGISAKIRLYEIRDNALCLPRGLWNEVKARIPSDTQINRDTVLLPRIDFGNNMIVLRAYQQNALQSVLSQRSPQGVVMMPCGGGKTETALELIARLRQPTLWITHTQDLVNQALERAQKRLGVGPRECGVIGGGIHRLGTHLTVATVQTLYRMELDELAQRFGCVIVDECHRVFNNPENASMFARVLACLPAHYRYGITASGTRSDGLGDTIYHVLGPKVAEVELEEVQATGNSIVPSIRPVMTPFSYTPAEGEQPVDFNRLQRYMAASKDRTDMIADCIDAELNDNHTALVLAAHLAPLEKLRDRLLAAGHKAVMISGNSRKTDRRDALAGLREGRHTCLLATWALAKEGLDVPRIDRMFFVSPVRNAVSVQQAVGRSMRPAPGKTDAIVYDFVDAMVPVCKSQYRNRKKVYKQLGCDIEKECAI